MLTLKELCEQTGATRRAIQGYEELGLLDSAARNKYGHLIYEDEAKSRVLRIMALQVYGFKLKEIVEFESLGDEEQLGMLREKEAELKEKKKKIELFLGLIRDEIESYSVN